MFIPAEKEMIKLKRDRISVVEATVTNYHSENIIFAETHTRTDIVKWIIYLNSDKNPLVPMETEPVPDPFVTHSVYKIGDKIQFAGVVRLVDSYYTNKGKKFSESKFESNFKDKNVIVDAKKVSKIETTLLDPQKRIREKMKMKEGRMNNP